MKIEQNFHERIEHAYGECSDDHISGVFIGKRWLEYWYRRYKKPIWKGYFKEWILCLWKKFSSKSQFIGRGKQNWDESEVKWNIYAYIVWIKKEKKKSYKGDCVQPLSPALSKSKQIMQWILSRNHDLLKPIQYQRQN